MKNLQDLIHASKQEAGYVEPTAKAGAAQSPRPGRIIMAIKSDVVAAFGPGAAAKPGRKLIEASAIPQRSKVVAKKQSAKSVDSRQPEGGTTVAECRAEIAALKAAHKLEVAGLVEQIKAMEAQLMIFEAQILA